MGSGSSAANLRLQFGSDLLAPRLRADSLDPLLTGPLGDLVHDASATISDLKADVSPQRDSNGNNTNANPLALALPLINRSISELTGLDALLGLGDYVSRYLGRAPSGSTLPAPPAADPSLRGLLTYLQQHWIPTLPGVDADALQLVVAPQGVSLRFKDRLSLSSFLRRLENRRGLLLSAGEFGL